MHNTIDQLFRKIKEILEIAHILLSVISLDEACSHFQNNSSITSFGIHSIYQNYHQVRWLSKIAYFTQIHISVMRVNTHKVSGPISEWEQK